MGGKAPARGQVVNRVELAQVVGKHVTTIDQWVREGCPFLQRGSRGIAWEFSTADVYDWRLERERSTQDDPSNMEELEWRHELANTLKAELDLAKAQGDVAYIEEVEAAVAEAFGAVRTSMRNIAARIAGRLVIEKDDKSIKQILLAEIDQALEALANSSLVAEPEDEDA
ncbi:MAG: terminase small subunit [Salinisphaera sp.]|jgi:phage terminase Nu1 subunit (DNA packaging protein)|nr:terminase small subunit [Salinisphaera sp.]